ncbi:MAG: flagellar export protein FliJ [Magnetococcales bacterium]|nr:flagellar export protein FliJ [Magnetococcales bacterium]
MNPNRFRRLVELRRIREETAANALARVMARIRKVEGEIAGLDRETEEEKRMAKENLASGCPLSPKMYEDFFRGQMWRRRRMEEHKGRLLLESQSARKNWLDARTLLEQAGKLAQKADAVQIKEERRKEGKELDMMGVLGASHSIS